MLIALLLVLALAIAGVAAFFLLGLGEGAGYRVKNALQAIFLRAEARGAFKKLPAFDRDYLGDYPALKLLEDNVETIRTECQALLDGSITLPGMEQLSGTYTAGGVHSIAWKTFMFKSGKFIAENCVLAPKTAALLARVPGVYTAFFSVLEPHQHIKPHWGYWKGFVRYHLGLVIPDDNRDGKCWIRINPNAWDRNHREVIAEGQKYCWKTGQGVMFDDTFLHEAANESDSVRVVLFLDVARKMPLHLALLNRLLLFIAHLDASVRKIRSNAKVAVPGPAAP